MINTDKLDAIYDRIIKHQKEQPKPLSLDFVKEYIEMIKQ